MTKIDIIAEAGVNHNGDIGLALDLVRAAADAGADYVKFQTFKATHLVTKDAQKAQYQLQNGASGETQYEMLKKLELNNEMHFKILECCKKNNIKFLSTAFDYESLAFLTNNMELSLLKIPSGELTNAPLILAHAQKKKPLIVSTGMATIQDIEDCLGVIAFGLLQNSDTKPSRNAFQNAFLSSKGKKILKDYVTILHCTSEYPAPFYEVNLKAMLSINNIFNLPVGYSDHTEGIAIPIAASAIGAKMIEKHFTINKNMKGPDHKASIEPQELSEMVKAIRNIELAMGDGIKKPQKSELKNIKVARKSIVTELDISEGQTIQENMLSIKRPGTGRSPYELWDIIGTRADRNYKPGDLIK